MIDPGFVCLYFGPTGECQECGGFNETGGRYCSHECGDSAARHAAESVARTEERRAREDLFATECERLHAAGHTDEEIDVLLAGIPT